MNQSKPVMRRRVLDILRFHQPADYVKSYWLQKQLRLNSIQNPLENDKLILLQHPPIYTIGRRGKLSDILSKEKVDSVLDLTRMSFQDLEKVENTSQNILRVDRGGEITHHCPGQLVAYFLFNLHNHKQDLHWFLRQLEEVVSTTLSRYYKINSSTNSDHTGVWVDQDKIAAIGLSASSWRTMHGVAINVDCDLSGFSDIVPCGISEPNKGVTRLADLVDAGESVSLDKVAEQMSTVVKDQFCFESTNQSSS